MTLVLFKEEKRPFVTEDELVQGILKYGSESSKKDILTKLEKSVQHTPLFTFFSIKGA